MSTGSLESLRERNRLRVIDALRRRGAVSQADIARETGLSRSTVSSLVGDLQAAGLVTQRHNGESAPRGAQGGRPGVLLALDHSAGALVGLDFGHDHLRAAVADLAYTILAEEEVALDVDADVEGGLQAAVHLVDDLLEESGVDRGRLLAVGVGLPGPLDRDTGQIHSQHILRSWVGRDPASELRERLGVPVHLDNDANVGALGELTFGAGRGADVMAYLRLADGIGAGIVIGGRIFRGAHGIAGEIGHVVVDPQGRICRCGNRGCLETFVGSHALCELLHGSHGTLTVAEMLALAEGGDAGVQRAITDAGGVVGRAVADLCNYVNPELVVVGGDLAAAGDLLLEPIRDAVRRFAIPAAADELRILPAGLGPRAEVLGALALAGHESDELLTISMSPTSYQRRRTR